MVLLNSLKIIETDIERKDKMMKKSWRGYTLLVGVFSDTGDLGANSWLFPEIYNVVTQYPHWTSSYGFCNPSPFRSLSLHDAIWTQTALMINQRLMETENHPNPPLRAWYQLTLFVQWPLPNPLKEPAERKNSDWMNDFKHSHVLDIYLGSAAFNWTIIVLGLSAQGFTASIMPFKEAEGSFF